MDASGGGARAREWPRRRAWRKVCQWLGWKAEGMTRQACTLKDRSRPLDAATCALPTHPIAGSGGFVTKQRSDPCIDPDTPVKHPFAERRLDQEARLLGDSAGGDVPDFATPLDDL